jgi:hypothetical protein
MPVWPLPALIALAGIILTLTKQKHSDLLYAGLIFAGCAIYYLIYIVPRRKTHWVMLAPPDEEEGEFGIHVELQEADPQHGLPGRTVV